MAVLAIIYCILGYWAVGVTVWSNWAMIGQYSGIVLKRFFIGILFGWILIPIALLKVFLGR